jgi:hypothetical protein
LPSFGPASAAFAAGMAMFATFTGLLIAAFIDKKPGPIGFWTIATAGEIVAWRIKWVAIPVVIVVLWGSARIVRTIRQHPSQYMGLRAARAGFVSAAVVTVLIAALIGITIPERLRQRQMAHNAGRYSQAYTYSRALLTYRELHGFIPPPETLISELRTLPDPDGSIAAALQDLDVNGYQPGTVVASAPSKNKPLPLRGQVIRKASLAVPVTDHPGVSFTNYELRLPGADKLLNTEDDLIVRDGLVMTVAQHQAFTSSRNPRQ